MKKVAVFFGGMSSEHDVSILTGLQILELAPDNVTPVPIFLCFENKMWMPKKKLDAQQFSDFEKNKRLFDQVVLVEKTLFLIKKQKQKKLFDIDAAIIACHGGSGENGELVAFLKQNGVGTSVGDPLALGIAMDKVVAKHFFAGIGVPVLDGFGFDGNDWKNKAAVFEKAEKLGFPVAVKPARQGSSIGVTLAHSLEKFADAVETALLFDDKVLVEKGLVDFREFNCSALNDCHRIWTSEIEEPIRSKEILTFEDKYLSGGKSKKNCFNQVSALSAKGMAALSRKFPADIPGELKGSIQKISETCVREFGLFGVVRLDFLFDGENLFLNEINAVPGSLSMYFWKNLFSGCQFFEKLVEIAENSLGFISKQVVFKSVWK